MIVYTDAKGTKFKGVTQDTNNVITFDEYHGLRDDGFHFYSAQSDSNNTDDTEDLVAAINSMPLAKQIELANSLYKKQMSGDSEPYVDPNGLEDLKKEYEEECGESVSQKDFEHELITGEDGILDSLNDLYLDEYSGGLDWYDMRLILNYLDENLSQTKWHSWKIIGFSQGDATFVWIYDPDKLPIDPDQEMIDDGESDYFGPNWQEYLTTILYGSTAEIADCDNHGESIYSEPVRNIAAYNFDSDPFNNVSHDSDLDEYMWKTYEMKPAKIQVTYQGYDQE